MKRASSLVVVMPRSQRGCRGFKSPLVHYPKKQYTATEVMRSMKVFNGKAAAEEYMSSHTLTFSTPELTLTRFAFWLGDIIPDPKNPGQTMLRIMAYVEEKDFAPVQIIDDEYVPTGAIRSSGGIYGSLKTESSSSTKFCLECGIKISQNAKFCTECGATQD